MVWFVYCLVDWFDFVVLDMFVELSVKCGVGGIVKLFGFEGFW